MYVHGANIIYIPQCSLFTGDIKFHIFFSLFPGKNNEIPVQFGFESQCFCVDNIDITKMYKNICR